MPLKERKELAFLSDLPFSTLRVLNLRHLYPDVSIRECCPDGGILKRAERLEVLRLDGVSCTIRDMPHQVSLVEAGRSLFCIPNIKALAVHSLFNLLIRDFSDDTHIIAATRLAHPTLLELVFPDPSEPSESHPFYGKPAPYLTTIQSVTLTMASDITINYAWKSSRAWFPLVNTLNLMFKAWSGALDELIGKWNAPEYTS
ncbi:hypothetical protein ONZ45_g18050 [Pleurotus djamor]|nr:hypothetical protein ONZ45_g18050 [Pleurotus djamor]